MEELCTRDQIDAILMNYIWLNGGFYPYDRNGWGLCPEEAFDAAVNDISRTVWLVCLEDRPSIFPIQY